MTSASTVHAALSTDNLHSPTETAEDSSKSLPRVLNVLLADVFALYIKNKNFHWHISGPHFRDFHLMLDEHADQLFAMTDEIAERVRKIGGTTIRSIGEIAKLQTVHDNDADHVTATGMLHELYEDEKRLAVRMNSTHHLCDESGDVATASLLENWIDQSQRRSWFLFQSVSA